MDNKVFPTLQKWHQDISDNIVYDVAVPCIEIESYSIAILIAQLRLERCIPELLLKVGLKYITNYSSWYTYVNMHHL